MQVTVSKEAVSTQLANSTIEKYEFEVLMSNKYPFRDPQIYCHTKFTHPMVCITDKRDLFREVVGEGGWKVGHKLYSLIQMIPEFIQEMYLMENDLYIVGTFHLGQVYDIRTFVSDGPGQRDTLAFACQEQIDERGQEFQVRNLVVTPGALLLFQPIQHNLQYGILIAWASL